MAPAAKKKPAAPAAVRAKQPIVWCLERADAEAGLEGWKPTIKVASEETVAAIAGAFEAAAARAAFRAAAAEEAAEAEEIEEEGEEEEEQGEESEESEEGEEEGAPGLPDWDDAAHGGVQEPANYEPYMLLKMAAHAALEASGKPKTQWLNDKLNQFDWVRFMMMDYAATVFQEAPLPLIPPGQGDKAAEIFQRVGGHYPLVLGEEPVQWEIGPFIAMQVQEAVENRRVIMPTKEVQDQLQILGCWPINQTEAPTGISDIVGYAWHAAQEVHVIAARKVLYEKDMTASKAMAEARAEVRARRAEEEARAKADARRAEEEAHRGAAPMDTVE